MDEEDPVDALESLRNAIGPGELPQEDRQYARSLLSQAVSGGSRRRTDAIYGSLEKDAQVARTALQQARQRLLSRPAYDQRDKWLAVGAQLVGGRSPSGRFGDGVADAVSALLKERGVERQALDQRSAQEFELDQALAGVDANVNSAKRSLALKREELESNMARAALAALKTSGGAAGSRGREPMSIQEWRIFSRMSPAEQERYLIMKRASQFKDVNEIPSRMPQLPGGAPEPMTTPAAANAAAAAREAAKAAGKNQGDSIGNVANVIANAEQNIADLDTLSKHPGLKYLTGVYSAGPIVPGTDQAEAYSYIEKLNGATFLEAFNSLRGGGQITEAEGKKATAALSRLGTRGMKLEAYQQAITDLREIMARGVARAKRQAKAAPLGVPVPTIALDAPPDPTNGPVAIQEPSIEDDYAKYGEGE